MSSPLSHGIQYASFLPYLYTHPEIDFKKANITFKDNYEAMYKHFGITRDELMHVMCRLMKTDPLVGNEILPYLPVK